MPSDKTPAQAIAEAAKAVEEAWERWDFICDDAGSQEDARDAKHAMVEATIKWLDARRAAREAGYVEVLVSREAVEALRKYDSPGGNEWVAADAADILINDLAPLLK